MSTLVIKDLHVAIDGKEILKGVNLTINTNEIHAVMGPNGTGKSTLASAIMGHPKYEVTSGSIELGWRRCIRNGSRRTCTSRSIPSNAISK